MRDWDPDEVQRALDTELAVEGTDSKSRQDIANRKIRDAVPFAADAIIHICLHSENEAHRMKAATYILDRVVGKPNDMPMGAANKDDSLAQLAGTVRVERN